MRRFTLAAGVTCAILLSAEVGAQNGTTGGGSTMPGQAVSKFRGGQVSQVGQRAPAAAPQVGQTVAGSGVRQQPYDPTRPYDQFKGTNIDPNSLVAPLVGADGKPVGQPDSLDILSERIKAIFGVLKPNPPRPAYAPGVSRRSNERAKMLWRRD